MQIVPNDPTVPTVFLNSLDADGTRWLLGDAEGWWTLPPPSVLDIPRPQKQDGSYDVEEGLVSSFPVRVTGGSYEIEQGLEVEDFARAKIDRTVAELKEERDSVRELGLV